MTKEDKRYVGLLIGLLAGMIIGVLTWPEEAFGMDKSRYVYIEEYGATIKSEIYPLNEQIEEAKQYLDERQIEVPAEIRDLCEKYGSETNICPELLESIIFCESSFQPQVENAGCKGLMQVKATAHSRRMKALGVTDLYDREQNIKTGSHYLKELFEKYEDPAKVLAYYNGDKAAAESGEMSQYATKVLTISQALERANYK